MGAVSHQPQEIVDLTSQEAPAYSGSHNHHNHNDTHPGRRKRTLYVSLLDDNDGGDSSPSPSDDEPEVVESYTVAPQRPVNPIDPSRADPARIDLTDGEPRPRQRARGMHHAKAQRRASADDLFVVSERQLTAQDRLREIQEQHRQGKSVNPQQRSFNTEQPDYNAVSHVGSNAPMLYTQHLLGGPLGPIRGRLIVPPRPRHHAARPRIWHTRGPMMAPIPLPGLQLPNPHEVLEQRDYEQALLRSLEETTRRRELDRTKLHLPPPPAPAQEGFTRSLSVQEPLVCVRCDRELGKPDPAADEGLPAETKLQNNKVFVRGCGHVYCGRCTYAMKQLPTQKRGCLPQCKQVSANKRRTFREVFI